jgi:acyl-CoA thioester hydrolase
MHDSKPEPYRQHYQVLWTDLDANNHVGNTRYLEYSTQTRLLYLAENGFGPQDFRAAGIGPVTFEDHVVYKRELHYQERFSVTFTVGGLSESGSKFTCVNRVYTHDGALSAEVRATLAWFNLTTRKIVVPPPPLAAAMNALLREDDFRIIPSRI